MPIYITQGRYTAETINGMIARPEDRTEAIAALLNKVGGKLHGTYVTFGEYDFLTICEAPSESALLSALLTAAGSGVVVRLQTCAQQWR